jgi:hypothetical protein
MVVLNMIILSYLRSYYDIMYASYYTSRVFKPSLNSDQIIFKQVIN